MNKQFDLALLLGQNGHRQDQRGSKTVQLFMPMEYFFFQYRRSEWTEMAYFVQSLFWMFLPMISKVQGTFLNPAKYRETLPEFSLGHCSSYSSNVNNSSLFLRDTQK